MRPAWMPALLAVLLLVAPTVAAFPGAEREVDVAYDAANAPLALLTGEILLQAQVRRALFLGDAEGTRVGPFPVLHVATADGEGAGAATLERATLVVHAGGLLLRPVDSAFELVATAPYGVALGVPQAPVGDEPGPGFLVGAVSTEGQIVTGGEVELAPLDALVSLLDAEGNPFPGWDRRAVNEGASAPGQEGAEAGALLRGQGAGVQGVVRARVLAGAVAPDGDVELRATRAPEARFGEAVAAFASLGGLQAEGAPGLDQLATLAPVLNGGILLVNVAAEGAEAPAPTRATLDGEPVDVGGFAAMRSRSMALAWRGGEMSVQGEAALAVTGQGVAVAAPAGAVGIFPLLSLVLWAVAGAALVVFLVRRPPKGEKLHVTLRMGALAAHLVVLVAAFVWWDVQFHDTFGTSFLALLLSGAALAEPGGAILVLLLELFPWGVAGLAFALPVRIALGVALRYLGKGKALKGFAKAGGLAALALIGPLYALWWLNAVILQAIDAFPGV